MEPTQRRERDLVLSPISYVFVQDLTKGKVDVHVGPHKTSLSNTDQPVVFDEKLKDFIPVSLDDAVRRNTIAPEGWYVVLKNPAPENAKAHPGTGNTSPPDLMVGNKVNIPGPVNFPLWPGQMVRIIQGHHLRSNQYLLVRVYNEEGAKANWGKAVVKLQGETISPITTATDALEAEASTEDREIAATKDRIATEEARAAQKAPTKSTKKTKNAAPSSSSLMGGIEPADLTVGRTFVIKGTEVSFYIPPTGIEVVSDDQGNYVRQANTLESIEYCILLDEDGNKRYERGPSVVFPEPTEKFMASPSGSVKFRAIELSEISGVYLKVIQSYEEAGKKYEEGEELFITGKEQMIYYPRPEHAIIKYGDQKVHHAVAIPAGEARYVMSRLSGKIELKKGPLMYLGDPRKEILVKRILTPNQIGLWFPKNQEALSYNQVLSDALIAAGGSDVLSYKDFTSYGSVGHKGMSGDPGLQSRAFYASATGSTRDSFVGDEVNRQNKHTPPRSITLETKYEGAVTITVWTGFAVQIVSKSGDRRVVVGPSTTLLAYDETLEAFELSMGKPKTTDRLAKDVYLQVANNKVSDVISAETKDSCTVNIKVSYRVNFTGEPMKWFAVNNYVKFLCDHVKAIVKNKVRKLSIQEFYDDPFDIVRDSVVGKPALLEPAIEAVEASEGKEAVAAKAAVYGPRPGRTFDENGMQIYEVEVLSISIDDPEIQQMIDRAQKLAVKQTIEVTAADQNLLAETKKENIKRALGLVRATTEETLSELVIKSIGRDKSEKETRAKATEALRLLEASSDKAIAEEEAVVAKIRREIRKLDQDLDVSNHRELTGIEIKKIQDMATAAATRAAAISPELVAALQSIANSGSLETMAKHLAPLSIVKGTSLAGVMSAFFEGTPMEDIIEKLGVAGIAKKTLASLDSVK